jgi:hypothetical protein
MSRRTGRRSRPASAISKQGINTENTDNTDKEKALRAKRIKSLSVFIRVFRGYSRLPSHAAILPRFEAELRPKLRVIGFRVGPAIEI